MKTKTKYTDRGAYWRVKLDKGVIDDPRCQHYREGENFVEFFYRGITFNEYFVKTRKWFKLVDVRKHWSHDFEKIILSIPVSRIRQMELIKSDKFKEAIIL